MPRSVGTAARSRSVTRSLPGRRSGRLAADLARAAGPTPKEHPCSASDWLELAVIAVLGVLVIGPDKMPGLRQAGRPGAQVGQAAHRRPSATSCATNLGPDYADLELTDLHPRTLVRKHVLEPSATTRSERGRHRPDRPRRRRPRRRVRRGLRRPATPSRERPHRKASLVNIHTDPTDHRRPRGHRAAHHRRDHRDDVRRLQAPRAGPRKRPGAAHLQVRDQGPDRQTTRPRRSPTRSQRTSTRPDARPSARPPRPSSVGGAPPRPLRAAERADHVDRDRRRPGPGSPRRPARRRGGWRWSTTCGSCGAG